MNSNKNSYSKQEKEKKPQKESLFGGNLLKIGRIILIVIGSCYLLSFLGRTPYVIFNSGSIGLMMLFLYRPDDALFLPFSGFNSVISIFVPLGTHQTRSL